MRATWPSHVRTWPSVAYTARSERGRFGSDAAVDLVGRGRHQVVPGSRMQLREGVRASGHRLRLERGDGPVRGRLGGDDAAEVRVEREAVDDVDAPAAAPEHERAVVLAAVEGERRAGAVEDGDVSEGEASSVAPHGEDEPRPDAVRPGRQRPRQALAVGDADRRGAPHGDGRHALSEQHADARLAVVAHLRARVVVGKDPPVLPAVPRVAVGAPLAQADAVTPAVAGNDQLRAGARRAGGRADDRCHQESNPQPQPHGDAPSTSQGRSDGEEE